MIVSFTISEKGGAKNNVDYTIRIAGLIEEDD